MINISIDTEFIENVLKNIVEPLLLDKGGISNIRVEDSMFVCVYSVKATIDIPIVINVPIRLKIEPKASDDAQNILLNIYADTPFAAQPISKIAAKKIAAIIPIKGTTNHGGTVIIPIPDFIGGITILLTDEHLSIKVRPA